MISRRALFGLSVGAAAAAKWLPAAAQTQELVIGLDFGTRPSATIFHKCRPGCLHTQKWLSDRVERVARALYEARVPRIKKDINIDMPPWDRAGSLTIEEYTVLAMAAIDAEMK